MYSALSRELSVVPTDVALELSESPEDSAGENPAPADAAAS
jgi:hypothetical protein